MAEVTKNDVIEALVKALTKNLIQIPIHLGYTADHERNAEEERRVMDVFYQYFDDAGASEETTDLLENMGVKHELIQRAEGEGGGSAQRAISKFTLPNGEEFVLALDLEWVSWDDFYIHDPKNDLKEVHRVVKVIEVWE